MHLPAAKMSSLKCVESGHCLSGCAPPGSNVVSFSALLLHKALRGAAAEDGATSAKVIRHIGHRRPTSRRGILRGITTSSCTRGSYNAP